MSLPVLKKVKGLIPSMSTGQVLVERRTKPTKNALFEWVLATPLILPVRPVVVYPVSGKDLQQLPEANRNRGAIIVESLVRFFVGDDIYDFDVIIHRGLKYKVLKVEDYELQGDVWITMASLEEPTV